jgi:hypothetical protein
MNFVNNNINNLQYSENFNINLINNNNSSTNKPISSINVSKSSSKIKIIHWNPNSIFNKKAEFDEFIINEINPDIISLNETKLSEFRAQRFFTNNNYHLINKSRDENKNGAGGVAILIKKTFKYVEIKESFLNEIEALAIEIY